MKPIFVHCHIFKNAGTSLIESFKHAFPGKCVEIEPHDKDDFISTERLKSCIADHPDLVFVSSHRIKLPLPKIVLGRVVIPIIFLRDPIDRLGSVYRFEKKQMLGSVYSSLAKMTDIKGFLSTIMDVGYSTMIANVQAEFCGASNGLTYDQMLTYLRNQAFIGLVEDYDFSLAMLEKFIRRYYQDSNLAPFHENTTKTSIIDAHRKLLNEIGYDFSLHLVQTNNIDFKLNQYAIDTLNALWHLDENKEYYTEYAERHRFDISNKNRQRCSLSTNHLCLIKETQSSQQVDSKFASHSSWVRTNSSDVLGKFIIESVKLEISGKSHNMAASPKDSIKVDIKIHWKEIINCAVVGLTIRNHMGQSIFAINNLGSEVSKINDPMRVIYSIMFEVPQMISGLYAIDVDVGVGLPGRTRLLATAHSVLTFGVATQKMNITNGCVLLPAMQFGSVKYAS
jgi:Wzt C-terminal domain/Sulfotransferase family